MNDFSNGAINSWGYFSLVELNCTFAYTCPKFCVRCIFAILLKGLGSIFDPESLPSTESIFEEINNLFITSYPFRVRFGFAY
jgi:hypothetical protein